eukprot:scaffold93821_cov21-Cyclotella_meneghiniana.AAC.3
MPNAITHDKARYLNHIIFCPATMQVICTSISTDTTDGRTAGTKSISPLQKFQSRRGVRIMQSVVSRRHGGSR